MQDVLNEQAAEVRRRFELPVLVAALLVVPVIYVEEQVSSPGWQQAASMVNWVIWGVFFAEYAVVTTITNRRWAYTRRAWLDVLIIVSSFPALPSVMAATRLLRLARLGRVVRLLRLTRLASILARGGTAARVVFTRRGLAYLLALTLLLTLGAGALFTMVEEPEGAADGLWWAFVTLTTVGYGDLAPETLLGRLAGIVLMVLGIGFVAMLTAAVAARFLESDDSDLAAEVRRVHDRLDEVQRKLDDLTRDEGSAWSDSTTA